MTKTRAAPTDPIRQLSEANATIEVLRRSVHEEHAGAAQAYLKLAAERERWWKLYNALAEILPLAAGYLDIAPGRHGHDVARVKNALAVLAGAEPETRPDGDAR